MFICVQIQTCTYLFNKTFLCVFGQLFKNEKLKHVKAKETFLHLLELNERITVVVFILM